MEALSLDYVEKYKEIERQLGKYCDNIMEKKCRKNIE